MDPHRWPLVTVDLDGTLTLRHGWAVIAEELGRSSEYEAVQARFRRGEVGEDEHLRALLGLAVGARWSQIESALAATPRLAGIRDGLAGLRSAGSRVAILTHNPPYIGEWYVREFGFDDLEGCDGPPLGTAVIGPPGPVSADKRTGLRSLARRAGVRLDQVVHVGDGRADADRFPEVGRGIAVNATDPAVERAADLAVHTRDFRDVVRAIGALGPRG